MERQKKNLAPKPVEPAPVSRPEPRVPDDISTPVGVFPRRPIDTIPVPAPVEPGPSAAEKAAAERAAAMQAATAEVAGLEEEFNSGRVMVDFDGFLGRISQAKVKARKLEEADQKPLVKRLDQLETMVSINKKVAAAVLAAYFEKPELQEGMNAGDVLTLSYTITADGKIEGIKVVKPIQNPDLQKRAVEELKGQTIFVFESEKTEATLNILFPKAELSAAVKQKIEKTLAKTGEIKQKARDEEARLNSGPVSLNDLRVKIAEFETLEKELKGPSVYPHPQTNQQISLATRAVSRILEKLRVVEQLLKKIEEISGYLGRLSLAVVDKDGDLVEVLDNLQKHKDFLAETKKDVPAWAAKQIDEWLAKIEAKKQEVNVRRIELVKTEAERQIAAIQEVRNSIALDLATTPQTSLNEQQLTAEKEKLTRLQAAQKKLSDLFAVTFQPLQIFSGSEEFRARVSSAKEALTKEIEAAISVVESNLRASGTRLQTMGEMQATLKARYEAAQAEYKKMEREFFEIFSSKDEKDQKFLRYRDLQQRALAFKEKQIKELKDLQAQLEAAAGKSRSAELIALLVYVDTLEANIKTEILDKITEALGADAERQKEAAAELKALEYQRKDLPLEGGRKVFPANYGLLFQLNAVTINRIPYLLWDLDPAFQKEVEALGAKKKPLTVVFNITFASLEAEPQVVFDAKKSTLQSQHLVEAYQRYFDFVNANYKEEIDEMRRYLMSFNPGTPKTISLKLELGAADGASFLALKLSDINIGNITREESGDPSAPVQAVLKKENINVRLAQRQKIAQELLAEHEKEHPFSTPAEKKKLLGMLIYYPELKAKAEQKAKAAGEPVPQLLRGEERALLERLEGLVGQEPVAESLITGTIYCNYLGRPLFPTKNGEPLIFVKNEDGTFNSYYLEDGFVAPGDALTELPDASTTSVIVVEEYLFDLDQKYESVDIIARLLRQIKMMSGDYYVKHAKKTIIIDLPLPATQIHIDFDASLRAK